MSLTSAIQKRKNEMRGAGIVQELREYPRKFPGIFGGLILCQKKSSQYRNVIEKIGSN